MGKDYYEVLELKTNANKEDIKKAYRNKALKFHPDKNKDPDAETKFKEIAEAYEVLNDVDKKAAYDLYGESGLKSSKRNFSRKKSQGTFIRSFSFHPSDPFDLFAKFFGDLDPFSDHFSSLLNHHKQMHQNIQHLHGATLFTSDPFVDHATWFDDILGCSPSRKQTSMRAPSVGRADDGRRKEYLGEGRLRQFGRQQSAPAGQFSASAPTGIPRGVRIKTQRQNTFPVPSEMDCHQHRFTSCLD